jgi:hypothetical protein
VADFWKDEEVDIAFIGVVWRIVGWNRSKPIGDLTQKVQCMCPPLADHWLSENIDVRSSDPM